MPVQQYLGGNLVKNNKGAFMRNNITVIDPNIPYVNITHLSDGEMFMYKDNASLDNVYMRINSDGYTPKNFKAVHLTSGNVYVIDSLAQLRRVSAINISREIIG